MDDEELYTIDCEQDEVFELTEKLLENDDNNCARFFRYLFTIKNCYLLEYNIFIL